MTENVIEIKKLVKKYGSLRALADFDMTVRRGEIHGFLGSNGAGKSTTIRTILGLQRKTGGEVELFGEDPWRAATKLHEKLAYVPGDVNFWPNLTGGEIIDVLASFRGGIDEKRRAEMLAKFELDPAKKFRTYSKGNRQKVALVAALASDAALYIFDEPTSGLDPLMEEVFQSEVRALKSRGKTILLSSHILGEVESLCDRVTIIRAGENIGDYSLAELKNQHDSLEKLFLEKYEDPAKNPRSSAPKNPAKNGGEAQR